jgi:hypothetical protein
MEPDKGVPRHRDGAMQAPQISDQGRRIQFGDEAIDHAVVDSLRLDPAKARPSAKARKGEADALVGRRKKPAPSCIEADAAGLEHWPQA